MWKLFLFMLPWWVVFGFLGLVFAGTGDSLVRYSVMHHSIIGYVAGVIGSAVNFNAPWQPLDS